MNIQEILLFYIDVFLQLALFIEIGEFSLSQTIIAKLPEFQFFNQSFEMECNSSHSKKLLSLTVLCH